MKRCQDGDRQKNSALIATYLISCTYLILLLLVVTWCLGQTGYEEMIPRFCGLFTISQTSRGLGEPVRKTPISTSPSFVILVTHPPHSYLLTASVASQDHRASHHSTAILNVLSTSLHSVATVSNPSSCTLPKISDPNRMQSEFATREGQYSSSRAGLNSRGSRVLPVISGANVHHASDWRPGEYSLTVNLPGDVVSEPVVS